MTSIDLDTMSLAELTRLQKDIAKAIDSHHERTKNAARAELEEHARRLGFTLADFTGGKTARKPNTAAKYRHPENVGLTWSGMGRKPRWVIEHLEHGGDLADLAL